MKRLALLLFLLFAIQVDAATYYVNTASTGSGDGTTTAIIGANAAWKAIFEINGIVAGDTICFNKGNIWREQLTLYDVAAASGTDGNPITISSYGSGAKPIICGADLSTGYIADGGSYKKAGITTEVEVVIYDGALLYPNDGATNTVGSNEWDWDADTLYVNVGEDPDEGVLEISQRENGIKLAYLEYITVDNIAVYGVHFDGIMAWNDDTFGAAELKGYVISNCDSYMNAVNGIRVYSDTYLISDVTISDCTTYYNGVSGIDIAKSVYDVTIKKVVSHHNSQDDTDEAYSAGIVVRPVDRTGYGALIRNCTVYSNGKNSAGSDIGSTFSGEGIWIDTAGDNSGANPCIVRYNYCYGNAGDGLFCENTDNSEWYYNISINNGKAGLSAQCSLVEFPNEENKFYNNALYGNDIGIWNTGDWDGEVGSCVNNTFKNNIASGNTTRELSAKFGGENDGTNGSGNVYTYNCLGTQATNFIEWGNANYDSTYDNWETAYGSTTNSAEADPLFVDATNDNFHLRGGSSCKNTGTDVGLSRDFADRSLSGIPDIGAHELPSGCRDRYVGGYRTAYRTRYE